LSFSEGTKWMRALLVLFFRATFPPLLGDFKWLAYAFRAKAGVIRHHRAMSFSSGA
jgi:hypothetical protein